MAVDPNDPIYLAPTAGTQHPELMLSAVLHLMSHYTADGKGCVKLASVIERHLKALAALPGLSPVLSATCQQLSEQWAGVVERTMPRPQKKDDGFLARLMHRSRPTAQVV
ncbi:hypothetical protein IP91_04314 [Pseudoduganella lurida]|uniref:Uncharacterized protein n=1 Tax=Pseudoduganella lurida TaxID=1036180 RepID=A0A562QZG4_9BURK|nr:hypothetical protein [Pseudoduganella lurida]TWI62205.1 hypothetical protein IP91_04314 [Pseudoduganella lurida]